MRTGITYRLNPADRKRFQVTVNDHNRFEERVRSARIVLATDGRRRKVKSDPKWPDVPA
jgi:hypothetical protein